GLTWCVGCRLSPPDLDVVELHDRRAVARRAGIVADDDRRRRRAPRQPARQAAFLYAVEIAVHHHVSRAIAVELEAIDVVVDGDVVVGGDRLLLILLARRQARDRIVVGIKPVAVGARAEGQIVPDLHAVKFGALIVPPRPVAGKEPDRRPSLSVIAAAAGHGTHFDVIAFVAGRPKFEMTYDEGGTLGSRQDIQMVGLHDEIGAVARPLPAPT